jgi:hypothetical protein
VGPIQSIDDVTGGNDDKTTLQKFGLRVDERGAYNSRAAGQSSSGYLVTARKTRQGIEQSKGDLAQPTQLRSILRDITDISDLKVNQGMLPAGTEADRVQLTIGPMPKAAAENEPTLIQELFLSPVFSTDALNDGELPQSRVQFFRAQNKLRKEDFHFAFTGAVSSFLKADGTVLANDVWPPKYSAFEAEGERRAYVRSASDMVAQRRLTRSTDPGPVMAIISDSLPQALLTADHAAKSGGESTLLTLPFMASDLVTRKGQALQVPPTPVFPLRFRFRGQVDESIVPASDPGDGRKTFYFRLAGISATVPFACAAEVVADRAGHAVDLAKGDAVSGDGILQSLNGPLKIVQLNFLGNKDSQSADAMAAIAAPAVSWLPRIARIETELQRVRGPAKGQVTFEIRGQIEAGVQRYVLARDDNKYDADIPVGAVITLKPGGSLALPVILPAAFKTPLAGDIISASGRVVQAILLQAGQKPDNATTKPQQVFLVDKWNALAEVPRGLIVPPVELKDEAISDDARSARSLPRLDWIVTISTDQGDQPVRFDALAGPQDTANKPLHHPRDISAAFDQKNQIWIEAICINEVGNLRGVGWPGWIAGYVAAKSTTLTMLDLRTMQIPSQGASEIAGYFHLVSSQGKIAVLKTDTTSPRVLRMMGELVSTEIIPAPNADTPDTLVLHLASLTGKLQWQLQCSARAWFSDVESGLPFRRVTDLLPGDCIVASAWPNASGQLQIGSIDGNDDHGGKLVDLKAGLFGRWVPASQVDTPANVKRLSSIALSEGSIDFLPGSLQTPRGISRAVWSPRRYQDRNEAVAADNALASHDPVEGMAIRYLPVAFARTIIEHAVQPAAVAQVRVPPIHAVASDCITRWLGRRLANPDQMFAACARHAAVAHQTRILAPRMAGRSCGEHVGPSG